MKFLVTGAAGFIASHLVDRLLQEGHEVVGVDNFSTGFHFNLKSAKANSRFRLVERDLYEEKALSDVLSPEFEGVFHLAANADVRDGLKHPRRDLEQNTIVTWNVLEAMRQKGVKKIGFSSTGSVYGEASVIPTPEDCPFPIQTSLYGTSKVSAEGLIQAYAVGYGMKGFIYRFVSILGERYSHGHVYDFIKKLKANPERLEILGNGKQRKSYLYIQDCISAILTAFRHHTDNPVEIYNLGTDEYCDVDFSARTICQTLGVNPKFEYTGGDRGWIGDNPFIFLDCKKIQKLGWRAEVSIAEAVKRTTRFLMENPEILFPHR